MIAALSRYQLESGTTGAVGEIGVHHGKLFLVLYLTTAKGEPAFACDVFERQDLNLDRSGEGDETAFRRNLKAHAGSDEGLILFARSSFNLRPEEVIEACGHVRFMSIDGGHTEECAVNELQLADRVLAEAGIAVVDDVFNQEWPGVGAGLARYLLDGYEPRLRPFAISQNKLYLARPDHRERYRHFLQSRFGIDLRKSATFLSSEVDIYSTLDQPVRATDLPYDVEVGLRAVRKLMRRMIAAPLGPVRRVLG